MNAKTLGDMPVSPFEHQLGDGALVQTRGITLRHHYAGLLIGWEPPEYALSRERGLDRARNPHNEPHKPRIRDDSEIVAALQLQRVDALLAELAKEAK